MRAFLILFALSILFSPASQAQQAKQWILGSWKSNRELTVPTIKLKKEISPELRARLEDLFGRMTVTYSGEEMSAYLPAYLKKPEWRFSSPYTVVIANDTTLVLRGENPQTKQKEDTTITFEGPDRYWINLTGLEGREYFDRVSVSPKKAPNPTRSTPGSP